MQSPRKFMMLAAILFAAAQPTQAADKAFSIVSVLRHEQALSAAHDVELSGELAFVAGKGGSIAIVDVGKPDKPQLVWFQHDPQRLFDAETVLLASHRLFLGTCDFISIDVANPRKPVFQTWLSSRPRISRINGMVRRGDYILAANKDGWIDAFDVSDPELPRLAAALEVRKRHDVSRPHDIDLCGPHVVVADAHGFGKTGLPGKVAVYRVFDESDKLLPMEQWSLVGELSSDERVGANRLKVAGEFAFVAGARSGKPAHFTVVDLSDPRKPRQVAALAFSDDYGPNGLAVAGKVVFLAGGQAVEAIEVSDPLRPVKLAAERITEALLQGTQNGHDLVYRDGLLYITGQIDNCLVILHVEDQRVRRLAEQSHRR